MTELSESAKVELMKLAVQLTQQYVPSLSGTTPFNNSVLKNIGMEQKPGDVHLTNVIDHFYTHLCVQMKP